MRKRDRPVRRVGARQAVDHSGDTAKWIERLTTSAAAAAGLVIFVHLLGGIVMWLRFRKAHLPADQAVALMTREQMLSVGLRLMVLPTIVSGGLAIMVARMDPQLRASRRFQVALVIAGALAVALLVMLPAAWATLTWLALLLVIVYAWRGFGLRRPRRGHRPPPWRLAAVAVLAAGLISLGRQIDQPVQLLQADVTVQTRGHQRHVHGLFVSADSTAVYVGDEVSGTIRGLRRGDVAALALGPPIERAPNRSLLSLVLFSDRWSVTPLRWWCNGRSYAWSQVGKLCQTQPSVRTPNERRGLDIRWVPVRVRCPAASDGPCRGYLRLRTRETFSRALGPFAASRRVTFPDATKDGRPFAILPDRTSELCVHVTTRQRQLLRARSDSGRSPLQPVPLDVLLSSDPAGASIMSADTMRLDVPRTHDPSEMPATDCGAHYRRALARQAGRAAVVRAVGALDGHQIEVRGPRGNAVVRLAGLDGPGTPSFLPSACGEAEGKDVLLRRMFTRPRDLNGDDGLADHPGGRAKELMLLPDREQDDRDAHTSYLLRHVLPAGSHRTLDESALAGGWVIRNHQPVGPPKLARALKRAGRDGLRVRPNLFTRCRGDHWERRALASP